MTLAAIASIPLPADALARPEADNHPIAVDVAAQPLARALDELSREANISIGMPGSLPATNTPAVRGRMRIAEALARLLAGTGLVARRVGPTAWRIEPAPAAAPTRRALTPQALPPVPPPMPIVVSAAKRETELLALPLSVTVVPISSEGRDGAAAGSSVVSANAEGVTLTGLGPGRNRMFLRGVADSPFSGESQSTVAVLLDDARVTYAAPDPDLRLVDVARVEVLKGPQGALYGTGTLGGIYRIVTNRADVANWSAHASLGAATVKGSGTGLQGTAAANLVLAPGRAALRLIGYSAYEPGWVETGGRRNANSTRLGGMRAELGVEPAADWRIDLTAQIQRLETHDSSYVYAPGVRSRPAQATEPHDNDLDLFAARAEGKIAGADAVFVTSLSRHEVQDTLDATVGAGDLGLADPALFLDTRNYRVWNSDLRLNGNRGGLNWLVGATYLEASQHGLQVLTGLSPGEALTVHDFTTMSTEAALYGDASVPLGSGFAFDGGARISRDTVETTQSTAGRATDGRRRFGLTPNLALSWRKDDSQLAFLRFGTAFRQGGLEQDGPGRVQTFASDELATLEAGWRSDLGAGGLLDVGAYYTWWRDVQSDMLDAEGLIETHNAGRARIVGVEASLRRPFAGGWTLAAGATWQDARLIRNALGIAVEDRRLPVIPEYTLRGSLQKRFEIGSAKASLRAALRYTGPARLSFDPALDRPMGRLLDSSIEGQLELGRFRILACIDNLFDASANRFAFGNPFRLANMAQYIPQRPRSVTVSIARSF